MILGNGSGYERKADKRHVYGVGDLIDSKELMRDWKTGGCLSLVV